MKRMLVNANDSEECRIAIVEDGSLQELHVELSDRESYLGNIYKGKVVNIEPSIGAAFVNFGGNRNGFLHASDVLPSYADEDVTLMDILEGRVRALGDDGPETVRSVLDDHEEGNGEAEQGADLDQKDDGSKEPPLSASSSATPGDHEEADAGAGDATTPAPTAEPSDGRRRQRGRRRGDGASGNEEPVLRDVQSSDDPPTCGDDDGGEGPVVEEGPGGQTAGDGGGDEVGSAVAVEDLGSTRTQRRRRPRQRNDRRPGVRIPINELLKKGQEVVVQITKEGIGAKGPTLTTYLSLPGRSLVLMPSLPKCGVSRKIDDERERRRLKRIVRDLDRTGQGGIGFIVRTAGVGKTAQDLERDLEYLTKLWDIVVQRARVTRPPAPLYVESDLVLRTMRDLFSPDIDEVVVDNNAVHDRVRDFVDKLMPRFLGRIKHHGVHAPLFHAYGIEAAVEKLYKPQVDLRHGSSIVIEQTEALVAIDVNSGKYKPGTSLEETAYRTNLEAIPEIVRQLRLRDLGGVIIIDFIDMVDEKHRRQVERRFRDALRSDRARINVANRISIFGMLEMTRQRVGPGLKRTVFQPCPTCKGTSLIRTVQSKALSVLRAIRALAQLPNYFRLEVYANPSVCEFLANHKRRDIVDLEDHYHRLIVTKAEPTYPVDVVHYRFLSEDGKESKVNIPAGLGVHA